MRMRLRRASVASFLVMAPLAAAQLGASCVDGVTPDCSDPAVCAPSEGDVPRDSGRPSDSAAPDAADGGDGGRGAEAGDAGKG